MKMALLIGKGLIANAFLNAVAPLLVGAEVQPVIFETNAPFSQKADHAALRQVGFFETGLLQEGVIPVVERFPIPSNTNINAATSAPQTLLSPRQIAQVYGLDRYDMDVNGDRFRACVTNDPDICGTLSVRSYPILKPETINVLREKGFLWNLHTGLLPKYKGVYIPYHALANGEKDYGWTLHDIDPGIDTGAIIGAVQQPLNPHAPVLQTYLGMVDRGAALAVEAIHHYMATGHVSSRPQTDLRNSYFTYPTAAQMAAFAAKGIRFTDDIIATYTRLFAPPDTLQEKTLCTALQEAVTAYERQHHIAPPHITTAPQYRLMAT